MTFGNEVRAARKEAGYTQRDLATVLGVSATYISKIENEQYEVLPSAAVLLDMEAVLEKEPGYFTHLAGKIDAKQLQRLAMSNPMAAKCLGIIQRGRVTRAQWTRILHVINE